MSRAVWIPFQCLAIAFLLWILPMEGGWAQDGRAAKAASELAFFRAVDAGQLELVEQFIQRGANPNTMVQGKVPLLHIAMMKKHWEVAKFLVRKGADINATQVSKDGKPAIAWALQHQDPAMTKWMLDNGVDPNLVLRDTVPILCGAVITNNVELLDLMIDAGADPNVTAKMSGETALRMAARIGSTPMLRRLLELGARPNVSAGSREESPLYVATAKGHREALEILLEAGADKSHVAKDGMTYLHALAAGGHTDLIEEELRAGADIDAEAALGATPLIVAARFGRQETVQFLLSNGANRNARQQDGLDLMFAAAMGGLADMVKEVREANPERSLDARGPNDAAMIHAAALGGHDSVLQYLAEQGADLELMLDHKTPLILAVMQGHAGAVKVLLDAGAQCQIGDFREDLLLVRAAERNHLEVMRILLASGKIDPNSFRSADGNAHGLLTAARSGNLEMVKVLVDAGMTFPGLGDDYNLFLDQLDAFARWDVSLIKELERAGMSIPLKQDYENRPMSSERKLMVSAARVGNLKLMEHLIEKGIDVNEDETAYGTRPIDAAVAQGRYDVVKFLVEAGASVDIYRSDNLNVSSRNLLLHSAVTSGNLEILEYLLELGADPDLRDQRPPNYLLPAELAEEQGRQEMAVLLRSKMDGRSPYELKVNKGDLPDPVRQSIQDQEQLAEDHLETMIRISQERFPLVATELNPVTGQPQPFQIMLFGEETIHVDNIYYSGFRFEVPRDLGERHLVWYQFMPTSGVMKPAPATIFRLQHPTPGELIPLYDENSFETLNFEDGLGVVQDSLGPWKFKRLNVRFDGPVAGQFQLVDNKFLKPGGIYFLCFETKRSQKPNPVQIYVNLGFAKLRGGWEKKKFRDEDWKVSERDAPTEETMISGMRFLGLDLAD